MELGLRSFREETFPSAGWGKPGQIYLVTWGGCGPSSADEPTRVALRNAHTVTVIIGRVKGTSRGPVCPDSLVMSTTFIAEPTGLDDRHQVEVDVDGGGGARLVAVGRGQTG